MPPRKCKFGSGKGLTDQKLWPIPTMALLGTAVFLA